jgi:hypothetical protein
VDEDPAKVEKEAGRGLWSFPLFKAILHRRSRRFGLGMRLNGGPLAYASRHVPLPLTLEEEAALAFAAAGITGYALGDLPYQGDRPESGGGQIMATFLGRTIGGAEALQNVALVVINDEGAFLVRRPREMPKGEIPALIRMAQERRLLEQYERLRVRIADRRPDVPRRNPFNLAFNQWAANLPGTSYFLPVNDLTPLYMNVLLSALSEEFGYFLLDERAGFRPAGLRPFARSKGGHLNDDPQSGRVATIQLLESWILEFIAVEQGMMLQNLALAGEAMGLGGFTHFAAHPAGWFQALGFRTEELPTSKALAAGLLETAALNVLGRDLPVPLPVGLERDGQVLLKPFAPPYYPGMAAAVRALLEMKYSPTTGTFRDGAEATAWRDVRAIQAGIPEYSDRAIAAVTAYCEYVHGRYGRFPAYSAPFRTVVAHQAHHLDLEFYDRYYKPGMYTEAHRRHRERWHPTEAGGPS